MKESTVRLKQLAEEATPGPWTVGKDDASHLIFYPYDTGETDLSRIVISDTEVSMGDKRFIAAANPKAVIGLIARIEKLEAALKEIEAKDGFCIYGSSDTSADPEEAFREGSAYANIECASIAREALKEET